MLSRLNCTAVLPAIVPTLGDEVLPDLPPTSGHATLKHVQVLMRAQPDLSQIPPGLRAFISDARRANKNLAESEAAEYGAYDREISLMAEFSSLERELDELERAIVEEVADAEEELDEFDMTVGAAASISKIMAKQLHMDPTPLMKGLRRARLVVDWALFDRTEDQMDYFLSSADSKKVQFWKLLCSACEAIASPPLVLRVVIYLWVELCLEFRRKLSDVRVSEVSFSQPSRDRSLIFISEEATQHALDSRMTREYFASSKQLFHYLRWTIKMQQIDGFYKVLRVQRGHRAAIEVVAFNTELHRRGGNTDADALDRLYIVGVHNDRVSLKSPKWKMDAFATAKEIEKKYGIPVEALPVGSRACSQAFNGINAQRRYRGLVVAGWLRRHLCGAGLFVSEVAVRWVGYFYDPYSRKPEYLQGATIITQGIYGQLQQIKTLQKKEQHRVAPRELRVSSPDFCKCISAAMANELLRIVSFDKHKTAYHIDLLLPVRLPGNNWIGIIFRDDRPTAICIDCNDIRTKSKLFDAMCDVDRFLWMDNHITRLTITARPVRPPAHVHDRAHGRAHPFANGAHPMFAHGHAHPHAHPHPHFNPNAHAMFVQDRTHREHFAHPPRVRALMHNRRQPRRDFNGPHAQRGYIPRHSPQRHQHHQHQHYRGQHTHHYAHPRHAHAHAHGEGQFVPSPF